MSIRKMLFLSKGLEVMPLIVNSVNKVGFIPTAGDAFDSAPYFRTRTLRQLKSWGYDIIDMDISKMTQEEIIKSLDYIDVLFIGGGNTFYLLQEFQKKPKIRDEISRRIDEGMLYIGESAGAIIACDDISFSTSMDDTSKAPDLENTKGFGFVSTPIIPHANHPKYFKNAEEIEKTEPKSISLNEDMALFVEIENGCEKIIPLPSPLGAGFQATPKRYFK